MMVRESLARVDMKTAEARSDYVGAFIEDDRKLTLVAIDPADPWEAFRSLRRQMKRVSGAEHATIAMFDSDVRLEHNATVVDLSSRRRAG